VIPIERRVDPREMGCGGLRRSACARRQLGGPGSGNAFGVKGRTPARFVVSGAGALLLGAMGIIGFLSPAARAASTLRPSSGNRGSTYAERLTIRTGLKRRRSSL